MKKYITLIKTTTEAVFTSDSAEKELFLEIYSELKSGDDYDTIVANIKSAIDELVVQRQIIMIVNMARDYVLSRLFTRILDMRWYNLKALVSLIRAINTEHGKDTVKAIKGKISKVGKDNVSNLAYNNELAKLVAELKKEYKKVITDDGKVLSVNVHAVFNGLTVGQKAIMLELLLAETKAVA